VVVDGLDPSSGDGDDLLDVGGRGVEADHDVVAGGAGVEPVLDERGGVGRGQLPLAETGSGGGRV
jgi:hypothetical protein